MPEGDEPIWERSPFCGANGDCVEVARLANDDVGIRHSRERDRPTQVFSRPEWDAFVRGVLNGSFDHI
ncbi:MAG: DUF397 domain-containing protein [Pseudonocardia sp.]